MKYKSTTNIENNNNTVLQCYNNNEQLYSKYRKTIKPLVPHHSRAEWCGAGTGSHYMCSQQIHYSVQKQTKGGDRR